MNNKRDNRWSRREFLAKLGLAGSAALIGLRPDALAAEPPPETTRIRIQRGGAICTAPQYLAEELLRNEGFTDVQYVKTDLGPLKSLATGQTDIGITFSAPLIIQVDTGDPVTVLGGIHTGCFELYGTERVRSIRDLKGKTVGVVQLGSSQHLFLSIMAAHVGLDPRKDINWEIHPIAEAIRLLAEAKIDGYMAFPPETQQLRAKKIGHVVVSSMMDRPWSQYFCCMAAANREFIRKYPVAISRALRAILKATSVCANEPDRAARFLVQRGYTDNLAYASQTLTELPYGKWREYDPEDTIRFYSLRLNEAGMIKSSPQKIIRQGTDWRFLRELKKELKT
jgi:NitT/TauT family transport system substrate-binding protein